MKIEKEQLEEDKDIYNNSHREEELMENDEISSNEAGFMSGYEAAMEEE